ncbi:hypothetical protein [Bradyrhizobium sp.]|uniref:hypothetical protein n=1 Tax=Bradyrhizobium sp. TaxID=376 RepID=UPI003C68F71E
MAHKFDVGQFVDLELNSLRSAVRGPYEIRHLIPASDRDPDDPCYRIKSVAEKHERVALESELTVARALSATGGHDRRQIAPFSA